MEYILTMTFLTSTGTKSSLTLNGVKADFTSDMAKVIMDKVIEKDIFTTKGGSLISKVSAEITERKITKFEYK